MISTIQALNKKIYRGYFGDQEPQFQSVRFKNLTCVTFIETRPDGNLIPPLVALSPASPYENAVSGIVKYLSEIDN